MLITNIKIQQNNINNTMITSRIIKTYHTDNNIKIQQNDNNTI